MQKAQAARLSFQKHSIQNNQGPSEFILESEWLLFIYFVVDWLKRVSGDYNKLDNEMEG